MADNNVIKIQRRDTGSIEWRLSDEEQAMLDRKYPDGLSAHVQETMEGLLNTAADAIRVAMFQAADETKARWQLARELNFFTDDWSVWGGNRVS